MKKLRKQQHLNIFYQPKAFEANQVYETMVASRQDADKHCCLMLSCVICRRKYIRSSTIPGLLANPVDNSWKFPPRGSQATRTLLDYASRTSTSAHCMSRSQSHRGTRQVHDSLNLTRKHMSELKYEGKEGTWKFLYGLSVLMKFSQDINNTLYGLFLWLNVTNLTI